MITIGAARLLPTARLMFAGALYVVVEGARSIAREQMASLLWPDLAEERATHALRQVLYRLRASGLAIDGDAERLTLPAGAVTTDYDELLAPASTCKVDEMLTRIPGGFLPGYVPSVSRPFAEWVEVHRERVNSVLRRQLVGGIQALRTAGDWPATQALAQRCLELDPLNEEATLAFAEAMAMDGSKARAIMIIDRYMNEIGPRAKELHLPATMLRKRISELYPLPPVIERDPPHTGREAEMEKLDVALKEARQGRGSAFVISGPPGIGKTRLVTEFTRAAQLQGLMIARSSMGQHDDHRPLGAWSDLVPLMQRMPGALGCDPESLPFLRRLTTYDAKQATPSPESEDAEYLFARIRLAILDLVAAVASESCRILLIEDVHWMDEWSWDVMSALTKRLERVGVLILMTRRDADTAATPIPTDADFNGMPLQPLDEARCRKLLGTVGSAAELTDQDFVDWCVRTCAGNPYFLIELGRRALKADGKFQAPPSLTRLISQRFLDVAPLSRRVLQAAAVLGKYSTLARIELVLDERRLSLLDSLDELVRHSLVLSDGERVICRHDLLGMSAMSEISALSLAVLHRHAANALECEVDAATAPAHLWDCAQHLEAAGDCTRAVQMFKRCASKALDLGAPAEAARVLEYAVLLVTSPEEREACQRQLLRVLYLTYQYPQLLAVSRELAISRCSREGAGSEHSPEEIYELDARHYACAPTAQMLDDAVRCSLATDADPDHRVEAALVACKMAGNLFAEDKARIAFDAARSSISAADKALGLELRLVYEGSFGSTLECGRIAHQLLLTAHVATARAERAKILTQCAFAFQFSGEIELALQCARESAEIGESLGIPSVLECGLRAVARIHLALGELELAARSIEAWQQARSDGSKLAASNVNEYRARLALLKGDNETAQVILRTFTGSGAPTWRRAIVHQAGLRALLALRMEGWCPTTSELADLVEMHREARSHSHQDIYVYMLSFAFEALQEREEGRRLIDQYVSRYRRERSPLLKQLAARIEFLAAP